MGTPKYSLGLLLSSFCLLLVLVISRKEIGLEKSEEEVLSYHTIRLSSLLPSSTCNPSTKGDKKRGFLEVVHKHGPCSKFNKLKPLTKEQIFTQDQSRVNSIKARLTIKPDSTLLAQSGTTLGSGNYIVTIGLGTPKTDLSLIFDTGSHLTWTQCQPCVGHCYSQKQPIFDPTESSTYTNVSCTSVECSGLKSATFQEPFCVSSTCGYAIAYGDDSTTVGFFAKEKLTLTSKDIVDDFYFGCGQNNEFLYEGEVAGLLGLGQDNLSIVSQTAKKYKEIFSYCLPSDSSSTGYLTFGNTSNTNTTSNVKYKYTPFSTLDSSLYGLDLLDMYVGGTKLNISSTIFKTSGMIIDSGTVITRLPPAAYAALRKEFRAQMSAYPLVEGDMFFDTCYDLSKFETIEVPTVGVLWGGDVYVDVPVSGILVVVDGVSQVCLGFKGNEGDSDIGIWGNAQQRTMEIVYDVGCKRVGFAAEGCS